MNTAENKRQRDVLSVNNRAAAGSRAAVVPAANTPFPLAGVFGDVVESLGGERSGCVTVVIPIYNEVEHVEKLLRAVQAAPVLKEIIVVDDGSTDGTREKLMNTAVGGGLKLVLHDGNFGKGAAIRTALRYAKGEYVLIQDSDLEYDPQDYGKLLQPLKEGTANVVYGVRPDRPERGVWFFLGAKFLTLLTNVLYRARIHDEATCYKAFRRTLLAGLRLECRRFEFCPEVTAKVCRLGERIAEVPISYKPRSKKGKKLQYSDGFSAVWTLLRYRFAGKSEFVHKRTLKKSI